MKSFLLRKRSARWVRRGNRARSVSNWSEAANAYRHALDIRPRNAPIWVQYGHALKQNGFLVDAELAYRRALAIDRFTGDTYLQLGHVLKMQGRRQEAAHAYSFAFIVDPDLPSVRGELVALRVEIATLVPLPKQFL